MRPIVSNHIYDHSDISNFLDISHILTLIQPNRNMFPKVHLPLSFK